MKGKCVLWAVDPFDKAGGQRAAALAQHLGHALKLPVEPVYVLSDGMLGLSLPAPSFKKTFLPMAEAQLAKFTRQHGFKGLSKGKVLVCVPSSRSTAAEALDRHARARGAALIVLASHGRSGIKRAFLGSFAETLVLHARTPVLVSGPQSRSRGANGGRILFPTDFGKASARAFDATLALAKGLESPLTVFHAIPDPSSVLVSSGVALIGGGVFTPAPVGAVDTSAQDTLARAWVKKAQSRGVKAESQVRVGVPSVTLGVLSAARSKKASIIAMAAQSSGFSAALLGSIGRQIAREAPCAVLFYR